MGDLSDHFSIKEFKCRCDDPDCVGKKILPSVLLILLLEDIRNHFGRPIKINCGVRCERYNEKIGGARNSRHLPQYADAADIRIPGISMGRLSVYADYIVGPRGGVGLYDTFVHVDMRGIKARWDNRTKGDVKK